MPSVQLRAKLPCIAMFCIVFNVPDAFSHPHVRKDHDGVPQESGRREEV